ncbi:MAG: putative aromatic acid decarboxylase [Planctomycetaceae bacterium]|nr:putative aromatic acid decarboxylase [Planctomycetaceae bacterium]
MPPVVVGVTGASGAIYGVRLLEVLIHKGLEVELAISPAATQVIHQELERRVDLAAFTPDQLISIGDLTYETPGAGEFRFSNGSRLRYHHYQNYFAGIASGSFKTAGMVICPCSMGTLSAIACGLSTNLIQRAADVHLKERRKLIVVPRETPLGSIQLENMKRLVDAGAVVLPASPGFYQRPQSISDLVDFVVARICDQLGVEVNLMRRWSESEDLPVDE